MCVYGAEPQLVAISQENTFTVSYTDENIASGGWYSIVVLAPAADVNDFEKNDLLFMKQCISGSDNTITLTDFQLKGDAKCGDLYINGTNVAVLIDHSCPNPDFAKVEAVAPTCTDNGITEHYKCNGCNTIYSDKYAENVITDIMAQATNHLNKEDFHGESNRCDNLRDADCTYCPDCKKYFEDDACTNEIVVVANHASVKNEKNEPTCTQAGNYEYYLCSVCSKKFKEEACINEFTDVEKGSWYAQAVAWASKNNITSGVSEKEFAPDSNISREQIATMLYRYAIYKDYDITAAEKTSLDTYTDSSEVAQYALLMRKSGKYNED